MMESVQMSEQINGLCRIIRNLKCKDFGQIKFEIEPSTLYDTYLGYLRKDYLA